MNYIHSRQISLLDENAANINENFSISLILYFFSSNDYPFDVNQQTVSMYSYSYPYNNNEILNSAEIQDIIDISSSSENRNPVRTKIRMQESRHENYYRNNCKKSNPRDVFFFYTEIIRTTIIYSHRNAVMHVTVVFTSRQTKYSGSSRCLPLLSCTSLMLNYTKKE